MIKYVFREDEPLKIKSAKTADPQIIGMALEAISDQAGGKLKPEKVVDAARDKRHPLHPHFEWDDRLAAEAFRLDQARSIIRAVYIKDDSDEETQAFLSIKADDGVAYRPVATVAKSSDLQEALMKQADRDLEAWQRRYSMLADICQLVEVARHRLRKRTSDKEHVSA